MATQNPQIIRLNPGPSVSNRPLNVEVEIRNLQKAFRVGGQVTHVLDGLSMTAYKEQVTCILGPSGCGKSTVLKMTAGFLGVEEGAITVRGTPVAGPGRDRVMVFQAPVLLPWRTVKKNVAFALRGRPAEYDSLVQQTLENVGLGAFMDHYPYQLSGGMKQRAQIARALVMEPQVLLLDEPFGALDAQTRIHMQRMLQDVVLRYKPTILFVTHDVDEAIFLADRIYVMSARPGRVKEEIEVPWPRPRDVSILEDPRFGKMSAHILRLLGL